MQSTVKESSLELTASARKQMMIAKATGYHLIAVQAGYFDKSCWVHIERDNNVPSDVPIYPGIAKEFGLSIGTTDTLGAVAVFARQDNSPAGSLTVSTKISFWCVYVWLEKGERYVAVDSSGIALNTGQVWFTGYIGQHLPVHFMWQDTTNTHKPLPG